VDVLDPSGHDANLHEYPAFTRDLFGLKNNQSGGGFRPYSERINFLNSMNSILPQMLDMVPKEGDTKKGLWPSLKDWTGPNSLGEVNKATRWAPFFSNEKIRIVQELKSEIGRVTRLWLGVIEPLGIDPTPETGSSFYKRVGDGKLASGLEIHKFQKACFDDIKRHRFALVTRHAQKLLLDDPRRMAFFERFNDKGVRQLLLGFAHPFLPLKSEELRVAVKHSFGLPLAVLKSHVGERIRNHENMPRLVVNQYGHAL
jgi:hypothetical protein